ncbi:hypothetical protein NPIL_247151 [Nephila pilipes]|uniref:Uncharacterized protein n=1 Tax=Nephila pilipes TaxID=299642 RepID=A0A8X6PGU4_NEPPI|nr:hypothetical protein NPIL_247151 [Nephila pilipes]
MQTPDSNDFAFEAMDCFKGKVIRLIALPAAVCCSEIADGISDLQIDKTFFFINISSKGLKSWWIYREKSCWAKLLKQFSKRTNQKKVINLYIEKYHTTQEILKIYQNILHQSENDIIVNSVH